MTRRHTVWLVVAVLFTLVNVGGGIYAALQGELLHTLVHAGLLLVGATVVRRLAPGRDARPLAHGSPLARELTERLTQLEQSVDAVAIEVERIGEGQRFMTRLFTEIRAPRAAGEGAPQPTEVEAGEAAPHGRR
jgi:hypothetical protein